MLPFHVYDVFSDRPFAGNPLALVEESNGLTDVPMQTPVSQFGLSETIFVQTPEDTARTAKVRIFTPTHDGIPEEPATGSATAIRAAQVDGPAHPPGCRDGPAERPAPDGGGRLCRLREIRLAGSARAVAQGRIRVPGKHR